MKNNQPSEFAIKRWKEKGIYDEKMKELKSFDDSVFKTVVPPTTFIKTLDWLDEILGGGLVAGRIVEIFGENSSGKTTLALHLTALFQKLGKVAYIDAEHALDVEYGASLGVSMDDLIISQPDCMEDTFDIIENLSNSGLFSLVVVDSVASLTPRPEEEGEYGDAHMGKKAWLMSQGLRKLTPIVDENGTVLIFLNQIRSSMSSWGSPEITPGGKALRFHATQRIKVKAEGSVDDKRKGKKVTFQVVKNKVARPYLKATVQLSWGSGLGGRVVKKKDE